MLDQHHVHAVVLAADLLQRDVPTREGICLLSTFGAAGRPPGSHPSVLQGWVYNVVPWLCAIPLAVGGGYVSDVLINKGVNPAAPFTNMSFYDTLKKKKHFHCFLVGYSVTLVRKLMQVNLPD